MYRSTVVALTIALAATAASAVSFTGTLSTADGGLVGNSTWGSNSQGLPTTITWTVDNTTTAGMWHYSYTLQVPLVRHNLDEFQYLNLETAQGLTDADIKNFAYGDLTLLSDRSPQKIIQRGSQPENMYGARFVHDWDRKDLEGGQEGHIVGISFDSSQAPTWGDFYANGAGLNQVRNAGFTAGDSDPSAAVANGSVANHLLVPGSGTQLPDLPTVDPNVPNGDPNTPSAVPEPITMLLMGLSMLPLAKVLRRRRKV